MAVELYEHNLEAYNAAREMLAKTGKAFIVHPTGTGKSFIGFKLAGDNPDKRVLWLTPSEYIVKTQLENLRKEGGSELTNITFVTYARLMLMSDEELSELKPDIAVIDEGHRVLATCWKTGFDRLLAMYPDMQMLGLSATHIRYLDNQRDVAEELFDGNIASEMTLGEAIVRGILLPPKYVISVYGYQEELRKYEDRVDRIVNTGIRDKNRAELDALRKALEMADGLDKVFDKNMENRTGKYIVFCSNKAHMEEMASRAGEWFSKIDPDMHVYKVYSDDPTASQDFIDFKADETDHLKLLFCIDMLNEGVHVEDIDGVILFRPTVSPIIYKQQIGRALSANKKKKPVIFDVVNNFENLYSISSLQEEIDLAVSYYRDLGEGEKVVCDTFEIIDETCDCTRLFERLERSLASTWDMYFREAKAYYEEHGDLNVPKRYVTDSGITLGLWITTQRKIYSKKIPGSLSDAQIMRLEAIGMCWENVKELSWLRAYGHAKEYYETYGDLDVKGLYICDDGFKLGYWIANTRKAYRNRAKQSLLTPERIKMLDDIGMIWSKTNTYWELYYAAAKEYYENHGDIRVIPSYVTETGMRLGAWIGTQKKLYNGGKTARNELTEEQIARLEEIGMEWGSNHELQWKEAYNAACDYFKEHKDLKVPAAYKSCNGIMLGNWIRKQRSLYKQGKLSDDKIQKLDRINMIWSKSASWNDRYEEARQYYEANGDLEVPQYYVTKSGMWLESWLSDQRKLYREGKLETEKAEKLGSIGMRWQNAYDNRWNEAYERLVKYYNEHGDINIDQNYVSEDGFKLGHWLKRQGQNRENLSAERKAKLEKLGFVFVSPRIRWQMKLDSARQYYEANGSIRVPKAYVTEQGYKLNSWIHDQRQAYKRGKLNTEQVEQLREIGIV